MKARTAVISAVVHYGRPTVIALAIGRSPRERKQRIRLSYRRVDKRNPDLKAECYGALPAFAATACLQLFRGADEPGFRTTRTKAAPDDALQVDRRFSNARDVSRAHIEPR